MREPATDDREGCETDRREQDQHQMAVVRPLLSNVDEFVQRQQREECDGENNGNSRECSHEPVNDNL